MSSPLNAAKALIQTSVRTFFVNPRHVIIVDLLLAYKVLQVDEISLFLNAAQPKEIRALLNPLLHARLVSKGTRSEIKIGQGNNRTTQREYYYVNYHDAVDAIKYRLVKLAEKVDALYKEQDNKRKDWNCPRCRAEYDALEILSHVDVNGEGFFCARCGTTLIENESAVRERGNHEKIRKLNVQLEPFNRLLKVIDSGEIPQNDFETAFAQRRDLPPDYQSALATKKQNFMDVSDKNPDIRKAQSVVDATAIETTIADEKTRAAEDAEAKRVKQELDAKQNQLPAWHTASAIGPSKTDTSNGLGPKREDDEENKKPAETEDKKMQDDLDAYMAEMERERLEAERKEAEGEEEEDEDEDEFEDIPSSFSTPASSQVASERPSENGTKKWSPNKNRDVPRSTGLKRERDDLDSVSGTDTGANTPMDPGVTSTPDPKRAKVDHGSTAKENGQAVDSDEDEDDFEDV